jgi:SET family sugar efflux transporter-like MFS transporter
MFDEAGRSRHVDRVVLTFLLGGQQALLLPYFVLYASEHLNLPGAHIALLLLAFHGSGLLATMIIPARADRSRTYLRSFRLVTILGLAGFVLMTATTSFLVVLPVVAALIGPAGAQNALYFAWIRSSSTSSSQILSTRAVFTLAWVVGPAIGGALIALGGYTLLLGFLALVNGVILAMTVGLPETSAHTTRASANVGAAVSSPTRAAALLAFTVIVLLYLGNVLSTSSMPIIVTKEGGADVSTVGLIFGLCALLETGVLLWLARVNPNMVLTRILVGGSFCGIAYCVILFATGNFAIILVGQVFNAIFIAAAVGAGMTWFQSFMPSRAGLSTGIFLNASRIANWLGALPVGAAASTSTGSQRVALSGAGAIGLALLLLIAGSKSMSKSAEEQTLSGTSASA